MKNLINHQARLVFWYLALFFISFSLWGFRPALPQQSTGTALTSCPEASFTLGATTFPVQAEINFTNQSTYAVSYHWDFGDGNSSTDTHPLHSFQHAGTYEITLTAYYTDCEDSFIGIVDIVGS